MKKKAKLKKPRARRYVADGAVVHGAVVGKSDLGEPGDIFVGALESGAPVMGSISSKTVPSLELRRLRKPIIVDGRRINHDIILHDCDPHTCKPMQSRRVALIPEDSDPDAAFAQANEMFAKHRERTTAGRSWLKNGHLAALGDLWKEALKAVKEERPKGEIQTAYEAEKQIITGEETPVSEPALKAAIARGRRRARRFDLVKAALLEGWRKHHFSEMRGPELMKAVHQATGIKLSIKTIRSLCNSLDLMSDPEKVKSGPPQR